MSTEIMKTFSLTLTNCTHVNLEEILKKEFSLYDIPDWNLKPLLYPGPGIHRLTNFWFEIQNACTLYISLKNCRCLIFVLLVFWVGFFFYFIFIYIFIFWGIYSNAKIWPYPGPQVCGLKKNMDLHYVKILSIEFEIFWFSGIWEDILNAPPYFHHFLMILSWKEILLSVKKKLNYTKGYFVLCLVLNSFYGLELTSVWVLILHCVTGS